MVKIIIIICLGSLIINTSVPGQYNDKLFSLSANLNYTTSAKIYLNPNASDFDLRSRVFSLAKIVSPSIDFRYGITKDIFAGVSVELIEKTDFGENVVVRLQNGEFRTIRVEDGFKVIPVELFVYYLLPFSSSRFKLLMGGGAAYYYGEHIRKFGNVDVSNLEQEFAYGIQVNISSDYLINDFVSVRAEMKFRDPEIDVTSRYNKNLITYNGQTILIADNEFDSRININGVTFIIGVAFHF